jgi:hypothetical protein
LNFSLETPSSPLLTTDNQEPPTTPSLPFQPLPATTTMVTPPSPDPEVIPSFEPKGRIDLICNVTRFCSKMV